MMTARRPAKASLWVSTSAHPPGHTEDRGIRYGLRVRGISVRFKKDDLREVLGGFEEFYRDLSAVSRGLSQFDAALEEYEQFVTGAALEENEVTLFKFPYDT